MVCFAPVGYGVISNPSSAYLPTQKNSFFSKLVFQCLNMSVNFILVETIKPCAQNTLVNLNTSSAQLYRHS